MTGNRHTHHNKLAKALSAQSTLTYQQALTVVKNAHQNGRLPSVLDANGRAQAVELLSSRAPQVSLQRQLSTATSTQSLADALLTTAFCDDKNSSLYLWLKPSGTEIHINRPRTARTQATLAAQVGGALFEELTSRLSVPLSKAISGYRTRVSIKVSSSGNTELPVEVDVAHPASGETLLLIQHHGLVSLHPHVRNLDALLQTSSLYTQDLSVPHLFLVTGLTGSGKSTMVHTLLNRFLKHGSSAAFLSSAADPSPPGAKLYHLPFDDLTGTEQLMRQVALTDPHVVGVDEVSSGSALATVDSFIAGRSVVAAVHGVGLPSLPARWARLLENDLGTEHTSDVSELLGLMGTWTGVHTSMKPKLCDGCKVPAPVTAGLQSQVDAWNAQTTKPINSLTPYVKGSGCAKCSTKNPGRAVCVSWAAFDFDLTMGLFSAETHSQSRAVLASRTVSSEVALKAAGILAAQ